jgi:hypothetical protein
VIAVFLNSYMHMPKKTKGFMLSQWTLSIIAIAAFLFAVTSSRILGTYALGFGTTGFMALLSLGSTVLLIAVLIFSAIKRRWFSFSVSLMSLIAMFLFFRVNEKLSAQASYQTRNSGDRIAAALIEFKQKNGGYPAQLHELTPQFLSQVPSPTLKGSTFFYRPEGDAFVLGYPSTSWMLCTRGANTPWHCDD